MNRVTGVFFLNKADLQPGTVPFQTPPDDQGKVAQTDPHREVSRRLKSQKEYQCQRVVLKSHMWSVSHLATEEETRALHKMAVTLYLSWEGKFPNFS